MTLLLAKILLRNSFETLTYNDIPHNCCDKCSYCYYMYKTYSRLLFNLLYIPLISHLCTNSWPLLSHMNTSAQHRVTEDCYLYSTSADGIAATETAEIVFPTAFLLHYFANHIHKYLHVEYILKGGRNRECCIYTFKCQFKTTECKKILYSIDVVCIICITT